MTGRQHLVFGALLIGGLVGVGLAMRQGAKSVAPAAVPSPAPSPSFIPAPAIPEPVCAPGTHASLVAESFPLQYICVADVVTGAAHPLKRGTPAGPWFKVVPLLGTLPPEDPTYLEEAGCDVLRCQTQCYMARVHSERSGTPATWSYCTEAPPTRDGPPAGWR